ncbi:MAG: recombination protein O N-terminal domain-containing protein [bacterium]|nr:recombination protein O N-terminal domain-containing protein [bacterium]
MYHIHHTDAFVIKVATVKEANATFLIFTRELGMLWASAQSVRRTDSKLRGHLREFSFSHISLVRGKDTWRITGAEQMVNFYDCFFTNKDALFVCARIFGLLRRLLYGEEKNERLFSVLEETFNFIKESALSRSRLLNVETIAVLRILHCLGYIGDSKEIGGFVESPFFSEEVVSQMAGVRKTALGEINRALRESHL